MQVMLITIYKTLLKCKQILKPLKNIKHFDFLHRYIDFLCNLIILYFLFVCGHTIKKNTERKN